MIEQFITSFWFFPIVYVFALSLVIILAAFHDRNVFKDYRERVGDEDIVDFDPANDGQNNIECSEATQEVPQETEPDQDSN